MNGMQQLSEKALKAAAGTIIDLMLRESAEKRTKSFMKLVDMAEHFWGDGFDEATYAKNP